MRRLAPALAAIAGAVAAGVNVDAGARPAVPGLTGSCGRAALVVLFWPNGHGTIRSAGLPASRAPHVELYRFAGAKTYRPENFVGSVAATGRPVLRCRSKLVPAATTARAEGWSRRTSAVAISCAFRRTAGVQLATIQGVWRLRLLDGARDLVLDAALSTVGASTVGLAWSQCRAGRAPG